MCCDNGLPLTRCLDMLRSSLVLAFRSYILTSFGLANIPKSLIASACSDVCLAIVLSSCCMRGNQDGRSARRLTCLCLNVNACRFWHNSSMRGPEDQRTACLLALSSLIMHHDIREVVTFPHETEKAVKRLAATVLPNLDSGSLSHLLIIVSKIQTNASSWHRILGGRAHDVAGGTHG